MAEDYEIHVTIAPEDLKNKQLQAYCMVGRWSMSQISDDEVIAGKHGYLTTHKRTLADAHMVINLMHGFLVSLGIRPVREKIEHVVFDTRGGSAL